MSGEVKNIGVGIETSGIERGTAALEKLAATGPRVDNALKSVEGSAAKTGKSLATLGQTSQQGGLEKVATSSNEASSGLKKLGGAADEAVESVGKVQTASARASDSLLSMVRTGVGAFLGGAVAHGAKEAAAAIYEASAAGERLRTMLNFSTGGNGVQEIEYLRQVTGRLGLQFSTTAVAYGQFQAAARGTALEGAKARDIFESIAKASAVMGLSTEQSSGVLLALQQMISKGTVQAEELRGQLGERLPGAFQIAAKAMGVTTAELGKMLEQGQVIADDFLPKFARAMNENIGGAAEQAADRLDAATNRFANSWDKLKQAIGDAGFSKLMKTELQALTNDMNVFTETMQKVERNGGGFLTQITAAGAAETGRLGFSVLNGAANLLNGTINALTGSVFDLRTDLALLPNILKTDAQQAAALERDLASAEKKFADLKAQGGTEGGNIYWRSEMYQLSLYIEQLKKAKQERQDLQRGNTDNQAGDTFRTAAAAAEAKRLEAVQAAMQKVIAGTSGIKDGFYKDLNSLYEGYRSGLIGLASYQKEVAKLINESGGGKAFAASAKEANKDFEEQRKLIAELGGLSGDFYKEWDRLNTMFKTGKLSLEQLLSVQAKLLEKQPAVAANAKAEIDAAKAIAEARVAARRAEEKAIDDFMQKEREAAAAALAGIKERTTQLEIENAAMVLTQQQNISLAEAMNKVTIARLQDKAAGLRDGSVERAEIEKQIAALKEYGKQISQKELNNFLDPSRAKSFGDALTGAFDAANNSLTKLTSVLENYGQKQLEIAANQKRVSELPDGANKTRQEALLAERSQRNQIQLYAGMAGAAKGFFSEGTKGYRALQLAETAFTAYQLAQDLIKGTSAAGVAVATQGQGDPYTAWARMAAMAATMASLGYQVSSFMGGGGGGGGGDGGKQATGTGTVLGDATAKSESISKSTERLAETAKLQLTAQSGMLASLRNIENNISGLAALVVRGSALTDSGVKTGTTLSLADPISRSLFDKIGDAPTRFIFEALFGKKVSVTGQGLSVGSSTLGQINSGGLSLSNYADVNSKQKFFGITVSNRNSTNYTPADPQLTQQFGQVFRDIYSAVLQASDPLGMALDQVKARLDSFIVDIGKIDLKDLSGQQIAEKLSAVLGAASDDIASAAIPGLQAFQKVGEGYFETVIRVASGVESAGAALDLLGISAVNFANLQRKQGDVASEIVRQSITQFEALDGTLSSVGALINTFGGSADELVDAYRSLVDVRDILISVGESGDSLTAAMIRGAGGLDKLQSSLSSYLQDFFTEAERNAAGKSSLQGQFDRLGLGALPASREAFRALVEGVDTSTEAGQKLYAQLISLASAFAELVPAVSSVADAAAETMRRLTQSYGDARAQLEVELLRTTGDEAGARARERAIALARDTAGLSDADAAAVAALYDYNRGLRDQIDAARAAVEAQKAIEAAQKSAAESAQRAAEEAARAADQFKQAWQSVTDSLFDEVARIRGLLSPGGAESLAQMQARFATTTAQARAGDQEAAKLLPGISQTLLQMAEANAASLLDLQRIRAQVAASLEQTGIGLAGRYGLTVPKLDTGTNYLPRDMLVMAHEGEAIVPRAYNPAAGGKSTDNTALVDEIKGLREENKAQALALVKLQIELNGVIKRWDSSGIPEERSTA